MATLVKDRIQLPLSVDDEDDFLATHVWYDSGTSRAMLRPRNIHEYWDLDLRLKAQHELRFWLQRLEMLWSGFDGREKPPPAESIYDRLEAEAVARTYRILQGLNGLLFPDDERVPTEIANACERWRREHPALADALNWNHKKRRSLVHRVLRGSYEQTKSGWSLSLVLLLIRAAAWSQVNWEDQPYLWEAHSAIRARQAHIRKGVLSANELAILTFLIRFQSAPGQWSRTTGDNRFEIACDRLNDRLADAKTGERIYDKPYIAKKDLFDLLGVLAHAQEFRNWAIEGNVPAPFRRLYQHGGYLGGSHSTEFHGYWELDTSVRQPVNETPKHSRKAGGFKQQYTWSYVQSLLEIDPRSVNRFRRIAQTAVLLDVGDGGEEAEPIPAQQITTFALDRESLALRQLRDAVLDHIRLVKSEADFRRYFKWIPERVPSESGEISERGRNDEYAIVVRLKDHITARHMVFADGPSDELENQVAAGCPAQEYCRRMYRDPAVLNAIWSRLFGGGAGEGGRRNGEPLRQRVYRAITGLDGKRLSPAELGRRTYRHLFGRPLPARPRDADDEPTAWEIYESLFLTGVLHGFITWAALGSENYCPTHLIRRFLKVSYRLRGSCVELPMEIDGRREVLTLPRPPRGVDRKAPAVRAIARVVCAFQVNKMMATPARDLKVGLRNLESTRAGQFWRNAVQQEFRENNYEELLGKYVDNFHRQARYVESDRELLPRADFLGTRTSRPEMILRDLAHGPHAGPSVVVGGIDIGVGSIKFGFYELERNGDIVKPRPWQAREPGKPPRSRDFKIPTEIIGRPYADADEFCERLLSELERRLKAGGVSLDHIAALGIAWPGPVRDGVVRDWSGILRNFSSHRDPGAELNALLSLDIRGSFSRLLAARGLSDIAVVMMNDGDSHAVGELTKLAMLGSTVDPGTQVLLKAGSGIAGAVASRGELLAGLMEFGKILSNLAYTPSLTYPTGLASHDFSGRTLPRLAQNASPHFAGLLPEITSIEVGLLAELAGDVEGPLTAQTADGTRRLLMECGKIAFAHRLPDRIDATELTDLLTDDGWAEQSRLRQAIEMHLGQFGTAAREEFRERIVNYGRIRLEAILQLEPELHEAFVAGIPNEATEIADEPPPAMSAAELSRVVRRVRNSAAVARTCVDRLGEYLADLVVLLYDLYEEYQMDRALIAGGVLSDGTREFVLTAATQRLARFCGIPPARVEHSVIRLERNRGGERNAAKEIGDSPIDNGRNGSETPIAAEFAALDSGTLGSAIQAARERLRSFRLQGLNRLHAMVYSLSYTEELILEQSRLRVSSLVESSPRKRRSSREEFRFDRFALTHDMVRDYLDGNLSELGLIKSSEASKDRKETRATYGRYRPA